MSFLKKSAVGLFFVLIVSCSAQSSPDKKTILVLGDSLSAGYGIEQGSDWVHLLASQLTEHTWINASISGETTVGGLSRLPALLSEHQPHIVIIELGANDGLRGYSLLTIKKNLSKLVSLSQQQGADVLLLGIRLPPNYGDRYAEGFYQTYFTVANGADIPLVPFFLQGVATNDQYMQADGLHPNAAAQPLILQNVLPTLKPLLAK